MLGYSYVRFSSLAQSTGDSLRRQTEAAAVWCAANGVDLVEDYRDLGVSAYRRKNATGGALGAFLAHVENGVVPSGSVLIVESLDRITRAQMSEALALFLGIIAAGVEIVTVMDGRRYNTASINDGLGELMMSLVILSRANEESRTKSSRALSSWAQRRKLASAKVVTSTGPTWLTLVGDKWEVNESRAEVVRWIVEEVANGASLTQVTHSLNARAVPTFKGARRWARNVVAQIVANPAIIGEFSVKAPARGEPVFWRKRETSTVSDYFPAIVPADVWRRAVGLILSGVHVRGARHSTAPSVFRGILFTPQGGSVGVHRQVRPSGVYVYLTAYSREAGSNRFIGWKYEELRNLVLLLCRQASSVERREARAVSRVSKLKAEVATLERRIESLLMVLGNGYSQAGERALREAEGKLATVEADLTNEEAKASPADLASVDWGDEAALARNFRRVIRRIEVEPGAFAISLRDGGLITYREKDGLAVVELDNDPLELPALATRA